MSSYQTKDIKNLALVSHGGAGKTTFNEMILLNSGKIKEAGKVENGNTASDFTPVEKKQQYSITNSYFSFPWKKKHVNLIDTPGYADFRGEVASAFSMVEGAVVLIDGSSGVEVNTHYVWNKAKDNNIARFMFINKVDKDGIEFGSLFADLQAFSDIPLIPMTIPAGTGEDYNGVLNLLTGEHIDKEGNRSEIGDEYQDLYDEYYLELIEGVVESDDELMMKYLEDQEITNKEVTDALFKAVADYTAVPVFSGVAVENSGVKEAFDYIIRLNPNATMTSGLKDAEGKEVDIEFNQEGSLLSRVGKTMVDPYIGKLSIFRVFKGVVNKDSDLVIANRDINIRTTKFYKLNGSEQETVDELVAGDIGAVAKIDEIETSDTISNPGDGIILSPLELPEPMLVQKVYPVEGDDEEKMSNAIQRYSQEDLTFKVDYNRVTKELLVYGMGTVHFDVIKKICKEKFDVSFQTDVPSVEYKETIQSKADVEEKYKKQSGGRGQYGHVMIRFEPLSSGKGFEFEEEIFGGAIPSQYIPAVEKGIKEAKEEGVLAGYPVVDFKAILYDGSYHDVDSSEMAFKIAASKAFKKALEQANPVLLEPVMKVEVTVPDRFMGDIMGDFNSRRGRILGMDPRNGKQIIKAQVPQAEMFTYSTELKSLTGGYGSFTMEFSHYDRLPEKESDDVIKNARQSEEE
ncbi:MAG: elongation factor G [Bacillota bacterium]